MRIVKYGDRYGIARGRWFWTEYKDLKSTCDFWWPRDGRYFESECFMDSLSQVKAIFDKLKPKGRPIKIEKVCIEKVSKVDLLLQD